MLPSIIFRALIPFSNDVSLFFKGKLTISVTRQRHDDEMQEFENKMIGM